MTSKGVSNLSGGGVQFIAEKVFNSCGQSVHFGTEYARDKDQELLRFRRSIEEDAMLAYAAGYRKWI